MSSGTNSLATELSVSGMTCGNCARHVTEAIQSVPGVSSATVRLDAQRASVRWARDGKQDVHALVRAIEQEGYAAKVVDANDKGEERLAQWHINLVIAVFGTVPLVLGEWIFGQSMMLWFQWFSFALASIVQIFAGAQFYRGAWNQLKVRSSNMDTLVALGSTTAYAYSVWALFSGHRVHLYFMEAASIITLISVGHWVESRVSVRASDALRKLLDLAPQTARRLATNGNPSREPFAPPLPHFAAEKETNNRRIELLNPNVAKAFSLSSPNEERAGVRSPQGTKGILFPLPPKVYGENTEEEVPVSELKINDLIALRPGDRVPTDGKVTDGNSAVDEAMLTGESKPVDKSSGSELYAGTVNLNGRLVMRVTATGEETALAHVIASVQRAQTSRANIQRLGDRVSSVFVPVVVLIALATGLWWGLAPDSAAQVHAWLGKFLWHSHLEVTSATAFITAAAVLIIACPCAMGLATPAAIMAGSNAAARRGILIRDGVALEKAGRITAIVLDKTGTLTHGQLAVAGPWTPDKGDGYHEQVRELTGSLAHPSNHPVSKVLANFSAHPQPLKDWRELPGSGVQAELDSETVRLGSLPWLRSCGINLPENQRTLDTWNHEGAMLVGLAKGTALLGVYSLRDFLKPNAAKIVGRLKQRGLKVHLLTGDNSRSAQAIAEQLRIQPENVAADVRPEQKAAFVKKLQQQGERVAFVGDGINDAPALEQADLGVAVSRASDIAREAADIILLNSDLEALPEALGLAQATLRTIKQNLFWAFFYNAVGIPLAALGFMSPILCAAAMGFSDLIVIGNALRLRNWKE